METDSAFARRALQHTSRQSPGEQSIEIHGSKWNADEIRNRVNWLRSLNTHWEKQVWFPKDIVIYRQTGQISFDVSAADDARDINIVKGGCKKDYCVICRWELWESNEEVARGTGYTNGREWVCIECYEKFVGNPNFFSTAYPEMT